MDFSRILIIRFGGVGDILMTTPVVRALADAYPGAVIDYIVGKEFVDAIQGHPNVTRVIPFDKREFSMEAFIRCLLDLAWDPYDLVLNLHPHAKSRLMALAARPQRTITFRKTRLSPGSGASVMHAIDDFAKELAGIGLGGIVDGHLDFVVPGEAVASLSSLLLASGVGPDERVFVVNPAASRPINRWGRDRFADVVAHFAGAGVRVAITGAPSSLRCVMDGLDEEELARSICAVDPRVVNLAGRLTLKEYGALLQRASAFLTCDTGPMHIGAAVGVPMVVLSGAADPDRTGPLTDGAVVIIDHSLDCVSCGARTCRVGGMPCMDRISVAGVIDTIDATLTQSRRSSVGVPLPVLQPENRQPGRVKSRRGHPAVGW